jgi:hypothetical protein
LYKTTGTCEELWKLYAVKNDTTLGELIERLLRKELGKPK